MLNIQNFGKVAAAAIFLAGCESTIPFMSMSEGGVETRGSFSIDGTLAFTLYENGVEVDRCAGPVQQYEASVLQCDNRERVTIPANPDAYGKFNGSFVGYMDELGFTVSVWGNRDGTVENLRLLYNEHRMQVDSS